MAEEKAGINSAVQHAPQHQPADPSTWPASQHMHEVFPRGNRGETTTSTLEAELGYCINDRGIEEQRIQFHS